jgi:hypothetical protein
VHVTGVCWPLTVRGNSGGKPGGDPGGNPNGMAVPGRKADAFGISVLTVAFSSSQYNRFYCDLSGVRGLWLIRPW